MDHQPKPDPGSPPLYASNSPRNLEDTETSDLIWGLFTKFRMEEYEPVEKVLVAREAKYQHEIGQLRAQIEIERLMRIQAEVEFNKREEQCQRGKRAQENLETLAKRVKKGELVDKNSVQELRNKIIELELQNCKMKELEQKWKDGSKNGETLHGLRNKIVELELQNCKLKELEQKLKDDSNVVAALKLRNRELEEKEKKNEEILDRMRNRNLELELENGKLKELEQKWKDDSNAVAQLKIRNAELEEKVNKNEEILDRLINRNLELEVENSKLRELEKKWIGVSNAVAELRGRVRDLEDEKLYNKNVLTALEEEVKKNLATIDGLRSENSKLVDEKNRNEKLIESMERKIEELNERTVNLEEDVRLLMTNEEEPLAEPVVSVDVNDEKDVRHNEFGIDIAPLQGNEDTQPPEKGNKDAVVALGSAPGKLKPKNAEIIFINLDDDEDESMSQELHGNKAAFQIVPKNESSVVQKQNISAKALTVEMLKRKITFSGMDTSDSSSSSSSSSDDDNLPISILGLGSNKKSKI